MRIRKITILNLNSLEGIHVIDFTQEPLLDAGIIAITGPTGSGKTTILDAISLALFAKSERDKKLESMMTRGTVECYSEIEFEVKENVYNAYYGISKANKKLDGKVQKAKRRIDKWDNNQRTFVTIEEKTSEVENWIHETLGMTYNEFTKSVILCQGQFTQFLDAEGREKSKVLEAITGTEIYKNIGASVFEHHKFLNEELKNQFKNIADTAILSEEELFTMNENILKKEVEINIAKERKGKIETILQSISQKKIFTIKWEENERKILEITNEEKEFKNDDDRRKKGQKSHPLKGEYQRLIALREDIKTKTEELPSIRLELEKNINHQNALIEELKSMDLNLISINDQYKEVEKEIDHAIKLDSELSNNKSNQENISTEIKGIQDSISTKKLEVDKIHKTLLDSRTKIENLKTNEVIKKTIESCIPILREKMNLYNELENKGKKERSTLTELENSLKVYQEKEKLLLNKKENIIKEASRIEKLELEQFNVFYPENKNLELHELKSNFIRHFTAINLQVDLKNTTQVLELKVDKSNINLKKYKNGSSNTDKINQYVIEGTDEEEGTLSILNQWLNFLKKYSIEIIDPEKFKDFNEILITNEKKRLEFDNELKVIDQETFQAKLIIEKTQNSIENIKEVLNEFRIKYLEYKKEIINLLKNCQIEFEETKLSLGLTKLEEELKKYSISENEILKTNNEILQLEGVLSNIISDIPKIEESLVSKNGDLLSIQKNHEKISEFRNKLLNGKSVIETRSFWEKQKSEIGGKISNQQSLIQKNNSELLSLDFKIKSVEEQLNKNIEEEKNNKKFLNRDLETIGCQDENQLATWFISAEEIKDLTLKAESIRKRFDEYLGIKKSLSEENERILSTNLDSYDEIDLEKEQLVISESIESNIQWIGGEKQKLAENDAKNLEIKKKQKQLEGLRIELENWSKLNQLIGSADGNRFQKYAQGLTLDRLIQKANLYLMLLQDRYLLERNPEEEELGIGILDSASFQTKRSVKTLSGGEKFIVSLSLALGLSDLAGKKNKIESLFIDEGFGSLDDKTLDTVIDALDNLQSSGKTIGVISHVKALNERLNVQIQVKGIPGKLGRSRIEITNQLN
jgi:DNA repair protein SbcC/Rad50